MHDRVGRWRDKVLRMTFINSISAICAFRGRREGQIVYVGGLLELHTLEIFSWSDAVWLRRRPTTDNTWDGCVVVGGRVSCLILLWLHLMSCGCKRSATDFC